jgi:prepilin-type N-terminal cleavage/methylation domain-containing protein
MKTQAAPDSGFSLLELIMVVVVMALVLAVTYPSLSRGNATLHLRTSARDVLNVMRYAREKAITEQMEMRVVADRENRKVLMTDAYGENAREYSLPQGILIGRLLFGPNEIQEGPLVVRFLPNGSSDSAELTLASDKGGFLRIVTDPVTGGARVVSPQEGGNRP